MEKKPNILMVHNYYQQAGGEDTVFHQESALLEQAGYRVIRYTRTNDDISGILGKVRAAFSMIFNIRTYREIKKIIREERVGVIHCHNTFPLISPAVYWAAKHMDVPVVQTVHNFRLVCPNGLLYREGAVCEECLSDGLVRSLRHGCYRGSKLQTAGVALMLAMNRLSGSYSIPRYVFLTEFNRQKHGVFLMRTGASSLVKPNSCPAHFDISRRHADRRPYILYFGRLSEEKGVGRLLEVWSGLRGKKLMEDLWLVIVGAGDGEESVRRFAQDEENRCTYLGKMEHGALLDLIASSLVVVVPSLCYEGLPMAIVESSSCGTPLIGSALGNAGFEIIRSGCGRTFSPTSIASFEEALFEVVERWGLYHSNTEECFSKNYSEEACLNMLEALYLEEDACRY